MICYEPSETKLQKQHGTLDMLRTCNDHIYLDVGLGFMDPSLQDQLMISGQLLLLCYFGIHIIQLLLQT